MLSIVLLLTMISTSAFSAHHFSELSNDGSIWRVDHFKVEDGKLQDFVETRTFTAKSKAQNFVAKIKALNPTQKSLSQIKFVATEQQAAPLWVVKNQWSDEWEAKYAEWVGANFDKYFYEKYQVMTDCADVAYSLRWIFSRINYLPAAATLAGSGAIVSQDSAKAEWNKLETHEEWHKDKRFLAGLDWLLNGVYTKTLYKDAYPIELTKETIRPGLINLLGGHTEVFSSVSYQPDEIPMMVLSSTMPKAVRVLSSRPYLDSDAVAKEQGGLLRFRWPEYTNNSWTMIPKEKMKHYSLEQYAEKPCSNESGLARCIIANLGMSFKADLMIRKITQGLEESIAQRIDIIRDGQIFCSANNCAPGTQGWEDWSTPSRDKRLAESFESAGELASDIDQSRYFEEWIEKTKISSDIPLSIEKFKNRLEPGLVSFDPRDSVEARWAVSPEAILSGLKSRLVDYKKERGIQIEKASVCRNQPLECQKTGDLFLEYSTLLIDSKMSTTLKAWNTLCRTEPCPDSFDGNSLLQQMWFQSPVPWHSLELRQGIAAPEGAYFFYAEAVLNGGKNFVILDGKRLYDLSLNKEVQLPGNFSSIAYDKKTDLLYGTNKKEIALFDQELNQVGKVELKFENFQLYTSNMGGGELLVMPNVPMYGGYGPVPVWIVDLKQKVSRTLGQFSSMIKFAEGKTTYYIMKGEKNLILNSSDQGVVELEVAALPKYHSSALHLKNDEFLVTSYDQEVGKQIVYHVTPQGMNSIFEAPNASVTRINSHFFMFADYTSSGLGMSLFDNDLNRYTSDSELRPNHNPINDETHLFLKTLSAGFSQLYRVDSEITKLGATLGPNEYILQSRENSFSYAGGNGIITKDYSGKILKQHPFILDAYCGDQPSATCLDPKGKMWMEDFLVNDGSTPLVFQQIGMKNSKDPMVFIISTTMFRMGWGGEMGSEPVFTNTGRGVKLGDGYMMWFAE
jgi:hypothetical protein